MGPRRLGRLGSSARGVGNPRNGPGRVAREESARTCPPCSPSPPRSSCLSSSRSRATWFPSRRPVRVRSEVAPGELARLIKSIVHPARESGSRGFRTRAETRLCRPSDARKPTRISKRRAPAPDFAATLPRRSCHPGRWVLRASARLRARARHRRRERARGEPRTRRVGFPGAARARGRGEARRARADARERPLRAPMGSPRRHLRFRARARRRAP